MILPPTESGTKQRRDSSDTISCMRGSQSVVAEISSAMISSTVQPLKKSTAVKALPTMLVRLNSRVCTTLPESIKSVAIRRCFGMAWSDRQEGLEQLHPRQLRLLGVELRRENVPALESGDKLAAVGTGRRRQSCRLTTVRRAERVNEVEFDWFVKFGEEARRTWTRDFTPAHMRHLDANCLVDALDASRYPAEAGLYPLIAALEQKLKPEANAQQGNTGRQNLGLQRRDMPAAAQSSHAFVEMADARQNDFCCTRDLVSGLGDADVGSKAFERIHHRLDIRQPIVDDDNRRMRGSHRRPTPKPRLPASHTANSKSSGLSMSTDRSRGMS